LRDFTFCVSAVVKRYPGHRYKYTFKQTLWLRIADVLNSPCARRRYNTIQEHAM